jgi:tetratricopeptide (TPR) repeat protein
MKTHLCGFAICAAVCLLPLPLLAQGGTGAPGQGGSQIGGAVESNLDITTHLQKHWIVAGKVTNLHGDPVGGVKVVVEPSEGGDFRAIQTNLQGEFHTEYYLDSSRVKELTVSLTANKKGFLKAHQVIQFPDADHLFAIPVTLRDPNPDPDLLSQADLIANLAPKLKKLGPADGLSGKSQKDYARGLMEYFERYRPDHALPSFTKVVDRDPSCIGCLTMLALADLDSGDWDGANRHLYQALDEDRKDPKQARPEPALALGVMESWRHEPERSVGFLGEALKYAPKDPLALQEIGREELLLQNWPTANAYLDNAVAAGASPEARLLRVEALLNVGQADAANKEMTRYLDGRDVKTMPLRVREIWAQVENRKKVEATYAKVKTDVDEPIDYLRRTTPELKGLESDEDQKQLDPILTAAGKNVWEFFRNFPNTSSLEAIHQEKLKGNGKGGEKQDQKFHYFCVTPAQAWGPGFSEYRANLAGDAGQLGGLTEGFMLTSGFASASLIFHPVYQSEATFRYLGRQKVNGREAHVVAFAQRPTQAHLYGSFKQGEIRVTTFTQGLAWIDAQNYQILRLRTDLLKPLPEVQLKRQTTEINFGEVHFKSTSEGFWLPREVAVTVDWHGRVLRNDHAYSDFKVFNVESTQKLGKPKELAQTPKEGSDPPEN